MNEEKPVGRPKSINIEKPKNGWQTDFEKAPKNGDRVMVSATGGDDKGVLVFWRVSKYVDKAELRYKSRGRWTDYTTRQDLPYDPVYWKLYNAEEYWPLQAAKS